MPRWASFSSSDYVAASAEISSLTQTDENEISIQAQTGDPDFRGFEIARTQFIWHRTESSRHFLYG